jgi:hypothetical protein
MAQKCLEELRLTIYDKVNGLGIGAQGLGGLTTVLDVKILDYPTHAADLPIAIIPIVQQHAMSILYWMVQVWLSLRHLSLLTIPEILSNDQPASRHVRLGDARGSRDCNVAYG